MGTVRIGAHAVNMEGVHVAATQYEVNVGEAPTSDPMTSYNSVYIEFRGPGSWAVVRNRMCLSADGEWDFEPSVSGRDDEWLEQHRFPIMKALELARQASLKLHQERREGD